MLEIDRVLLAVDLRLGSGAVGAVGAHVPLHVCDVVEFGNVTVFCHIWAFVLGHGGEEVVDDFIGDEGVAEVEFGDVWLVKC